MNYLLHIFRFVVLYVTRIHFEYMIIYPVHLLIDQRSKEQIIANTY